MCELTTRVLRTILTISDILSWCTPFCMNHFTFNVFELMRSSIKISQPSKMPKPINDFQYAWNNSSLTALFFLPLFFGQCVEAEADAAVDIDAIAKSRYIRNTIING
jgi:hypothetical protein